jgi:outer membrane lipoprotein SlyB
MKTLSRIFFALVAGASLAIAYAQPGPYTPYYPPPPSDRVEFGVVENIEVYPGGQPHNPINLGTVIGGVAGGVIGHQFGSGRGNTAATIAGAGVGAVVGNEVDKSRQQREPDRYRVFVRLDSGATLALTEVGEGEFHVGDRVRVVNNRIYRG